MRHVILPGIEADLRPGGEATVAYDDVPPSMNSTASGYKGNWRAGAQTKKRWEGIFATLFLAVRLPRGLTRVEATATLRFPQKRRRDEGNFRMVIEKALGDALVAGGWLADDDASRFSFRQLEFEDERGPKRTRVTLTFEGGAPTAPTIP